MFFAERSRTLRVRRARQTRALRLRAELRRAPLRTLVVCSYQYSYSTPQLRSNTQAVVISGGMSGVSAAYWLRRFGVEVTLIERRGLSGGATARLLNSLDY